MVIEITPGSAPPADLACVGRNQHGQIEVRGSADRVAVYTGPDLCLVSPDVGQLITELDARDRRPGFDPRAISAFLHHGFAFAPGTVFDHVLELGVGDRLVVSDGYGYGATCEWPWLGARSRGDEPASTDRLLELLTAAVHRDLGQHPATLMLSSGKDSVALALACREAGRGDVRAITYESDAGGEGADAAMFAARVGIEHEIVTLPEDRAQVEEVMNAYFERGALPCGDPTFIPLLLSVAELSLRPEERIIDGLGNDSWMGYLPSRAEARGVERSDRWLHWLRPLRPLVGPESPVSAALKNRAEWNFFGGRWLRYCDTTAFYGEAVDTGAQLQQQCDGLRGLDDVDFRSLIRGRHADHNSMIPKARVACGVLGCEPSFPYFDDELATYYFHLPEPDRFDRASLTNKVLLRRLLREKLDYDDARLGKRVFEFDGVGFLERHRSFVLDEITSCPLWNDRAGPLVTGLMDRPRALRKVWPSLLALFQLSGWVTRHTPEGVEP